MLAEYGGRPQATAQHTCLKNKAPGSLHVKQAARNSNTPIQDIKPVFTGNGKPQVYRAVRLAVAWALKSNLFTPHQFAGTDAPISDEVKVEVAATLLTLPYMVHVFLLQFSATTPWFHTIDLFLCAALSQAIHWFRTSMKTSTSPAHDNFPLAHNVTPLSAGALAVLKHITRMIYAARPDINQTWRLD